MTESRRGFMKGAAAATGGLALVGPIQGGTSAARAQQQDMGTIADPGDVTGPVRALTARGEGHRFVWMGDCCSGRPGHQHERNFAAVNKILRNLDPMPEHVAFLGDDINAYVDDEAELRAQWKHFLEHELNFLPASVPVHHITSNHNTYSPMSEQVFREVFPNLPKNGPVGQEGLSYWVRDRDLIMVMVNTSFSGLGGDGHVEVEWLDRTLAEHADARHKLVLGHHPAFPVNSYANFGSLQDIPARRPSGIPLFHWHIVADDRRAFWDVLVRHKVMAYLCSHIIAYDLQVHDGVLQVCTAGAGTNWGPEGFMPGATEYLHLIQGTLDASGLSYQVIDTHGRMREWLRWPLEMAAASSWQPIREDGPLAEPEGWKERPGTQHALAFDLTGTLGSGAEHKQTLLCGWDNLEGPHIAWMGLTDADNRLEVRLVPVAGHGEQVWSGPVLGSGGPLQLQLLVHTGMGPGGIMYRTAESAPWMSLVTSTSRGAEAMRWPGRWAAGHGMGGSSHMPFRGFGLEARWHAETHRQDQAV